MPATDRDVLDRAVASHATRRGEKLRGHGLATDHVTVFLHPSEHDNGPQRSASLTLDLPEATADTLVLVKAACWGARRVWRAGFRHSKVGLLTVVVIILKGQAAVEFAGSTTLSLEGRKSGAYAGFVIVTDRSFTGTLAISTKNAQKLLGTIYLPNATLEVSGNNNRVADQSPWTVVVAKEIDVKGSAARHQRGLRRLPHPRTGRGRAG